MDTQLSICFSCITLKFKYFIFSNLQNIFIMHIPMMAIFFIVLENEIYSLW